MGTGWGVPCPGPGKGMGVGWDRGYPVLVLAGRDGGGMGQGVPSTGPGLGIPFPVVGKLKELPSRHTPYTGGNNDKPSSLIIYTDIGDFPKLPATCQIFLLFNSFVKCVVVTDKFVTKWSSIL